MNNNKVTVEKEAKLSSAAESSKNQRRVVKPVGNSLAFWLGRLAFVSDGVSNNGRFEAERPPTSVGPPSGG